MDISCLLPGSKYSSSYAQGKAESALSKGLVLSCLLTLYTAVMSFEIPCSYDAKLCTCCVHDNYDAENREAEGRITHGTPQTPASMMLTQCEDDKSEGRLRWNHKALIVR